MNRIFNSSSFLVLLSFYVMGCGGKTSLVAGDVAPDFTLQNDSGESVTLSNYRGKKIVLFFYPKDGSPVCTKQSCSFRDSYEVFQKAKTEVFGISVDNVESHKEFKTEQGINFQLLSDEKKDVSKLYGVLNLMGYSNRVTFLIDEKGKIKKIYSDIDVENHINNILKDLG